VEGHGESTAFPILESLPHRLLVDSAFRLFHSAVTVAKQLNGRVGMFSRIGRWGTWYIPATLGLINVVTAPPEMKMRTLFEEGVGLLEVLLGQVQVHGLR
jgi:hypothetical protein